VSTVPAERDQLEDDGVTDQAFITTRVVDYLPGLALLIVVGLLGKYAEVGWLALAKHEHWTVPDIEFVLWAILIGLVITNTVGLHRVFQPGVLTYHFWLKVGIVALGSRFVLGDVLKLGAASLVQILVDMVVAGSIILAAARLSASLASSDRCWRLAPRSVGFRHRRVQGRYPSAQFGCWLRDRRDPCSWCCGAVHPASVGPRDRVE
jgi:integral membrane protein